MGTGRDLDGTSYEAAEEQTVADEEWPVAEHYRVETPARPGEDDAPAVASQDVAAEPAGRRFSPELGRGALSAAVVVLLLLLLIPTGIWLAARSDDDTNAVAGTGGATEPPPTTESETSTTTPSAGTQIPDASGRSLSQARELLEAAGFRVRFERVASERPQGDVVGQAPEPGERAEPRSIVVLTVSEGAARIVVPNVEGLSADDARARLRDTGLGTRTHAIASDEPSGTVIEQTPAAGEEVSEGAVVAIGISEQRENPPPAAEPATVRVPGVVGTRSSEARSRLRAAGLRVTQRPVESQRAAGEVVSQSPRANSELREGGTVMLRVSTGPPGLEVPDVAGLDEASASRELEAAGFAVRVVEEPTTEPADDGVVVAQSPAAGTTRRNGAMVTITVARLSQTTTESSSPPA